MFDEYTFLNDFTFDKYFGFTESEVKNLCSKQKNISMTKLRDWYDGYRTLKVHMKFITPDQLRLF